MKSSILSLPEKAEFTVRFSVVYSLIILLWVIDMISLNIAGFQDIKPSFMVMVIFYWSIYRPTLIPSWMAFIMGIILDLVTGMPVGLSACLFVIIQRILIDQRLTFTGQAFLTVFFGYISVSVFFYGAQWLVFGLINSYFVSYELMLGKMIMALIFFPVFYLVIHLTHKVLPEEKSQKQTGIGKIAVSGR